MGNGREFAAFEEGFDDAKAGGARLFWVELCREDVGAANRSDVGFGAVGGGRHGPALSFEFGGGVGGEV